MLHRKQIMGPWPDSKMVLSGRNVFSSRHNWLKSTKNASNIEQHHALSAVKEMKDQVAFNHDNILFNNAEVDASCST